MLKKILSKRRLVQVLLAVMLYLFVSYFKISILYVVIFGGLLGVIFGKVFCRWMCPIGLMVEFMLGRASGNEQNLQMYNYHKLGCPIAWVSGFLNRYSLFKIKNDTEACISCGKCDKACYIASLDKNYSLYNVKKNDPSSHFSCSKCLACVKECPTGSLKYKI